MDGKRGSRVVRRVGTGLYVEGADKGTPVEWFPLKGSEIVGRRGGYMIKYEVMYVDARRGEVRLRVMGVEPLPQALATEADPDPASMYEDAEEDDLEPLDNSEPGSGGDSERGQGIVEFGLILFLLGLLVLLIVFIIGLVNVPEPDFDPLGATEAASAVFVRVFGRQVFTLL